MINLFRNIVAARRVTAVGTLLGALLVSGTVGLAHSDRRASKTALEGTWLVRVTLRACDTNAAIGSFNSLVSFHEGGTLSETTASPGFAAGQRSPGHGNWDFEGHHTYSQRMISLITFDTAANLPGTPGFNPSLPITPGFFAGSVIVTHTVELTDSDHGTSAGTNAFYKTDGTLYRNGCSTADLVRFE